jgi:hypothetical protein
MTVIRNVRTNCHMGRIVPQEPMNTTTDGEPEVHIHLYLDEPPRAPSAARQPVSRRATRDAASFGPEFVRALATIDAMENQRVREAIERERIASQIYGYGD